MHTAVLGFAAIGLALAAAPLPAPHPLPSPSASPGMPFVAPTPAVPMTPKLRMQLAREFLRAQKGELKALEFRQRFELKELKASQQARLKDWERKETEARHQYFAAHSAGPDKRAYVKDFVERRKAFLQILVDERAARARDQQVRADSVKSDQAGRLKVFIEHLDRGEKPNDDLWPQAGH
jgi:hypothetical protein